MRKPELIRASTHGRMAVKKPRRFDASRTPRVPMTGISSACASLRAGRSSRMIHWAPTSRWRFPEILGYSPEDPQYKALQRMWEQATGKKIPRDSESESGNMNQKESDEDADQGAQDRADEQ